MMAMPAVGLLWLLLAEVGTPAQSPPAAAVAAAPAPAGSADAASGAASVPQRIFNTRTQAFTDFEAMLADLSHADVILVGEQHDDPNTHRVESAILQGLLGRDIAVTLSLEMFERDVQTALDAYLAGGRSEAAFLEASRPWPRYASDYRPLVETAKTWAWPVIAANVPRRIASEIARNGLETLSTLPVRDRALIASSLQCPEDVYFDRFAATMGEHPGPTVSAPDTPAVRRATIERYYQSQCAKDETMAESIAASFEQRPHGTGTGPIVHVTGAFHSDFGAGTAERVRRRLPGRRIVVLSILPRASIEGIVPGAEDVGRGEYLVYTAVGSR